LKDRLKRWESTTLAGIIVKGDPVPASLPPDMPDSEVCASDEYKLGKDDELHQTFEVSGKAPSWLTLEIERIYTRIGKPTLLDRLLRPMFMHENKVVKVEADGTYRFSLKTHGWLDCGTKYRLDRVMVEMRGVARKHVYPFQFVIFHRENAILGGNLGHLLRIPPITEVGKIGVRLVPGSLDRPTPQFQSDAFATFYARDGRFLGVHHQITNKIRLPPRAGVTKATIDFEIPPELVPSSR
jgi:hypothetical protein